MTIDAASVMAWLADHSLRVAGLILVVGIGSLLAYRTSTHSRLFAWTVVLYVAAAMPLLTIVLPDFQLPISFDDPVIVVSGGGLQTNQSALNLDAGVTRSLPSAFPWLSTLYLVGAAVLLIRVALGAYITSRLVRRARPVDDSALLNEVSELSASMQLAKAPRIRQHPLIHVPFVSGVLRPALLLPEKWSTWDAAMRRAVLTHELSHIARRDLWTMHLAVLYRAATWLNPMSWWLRRKLDTLAERASDDAVLAAGVEPTTYAELLVEFMNAAHRTPGRAHWRLAMARSGGFEARQRVKRVLSTHEGGNVRIGIPSRVLIGVVVFAAAVPSIVLTAGQPEEVSIQAPAELPAIALDPVVVAPVQKPAPPTPVKRLEFKASVIDAPSGKSIEFIAIPVQENNQEPEPWRSTKLATDEGVTVPNATVRVNAKYTPEAMRARIQGRVIVEVIVSPEGHVTAARVLKSVDTVFGLDEEAIKAITQWKFQPGTYQGQPIALRVELEMEFRLH